MHDWWIGMIVARYGKIKYLNSQTILYRQHEHNQVGSGRINRQYFYDRLLHAWRIVNINYKYYRMLKYLPFNVNIWGCIKAKLRLSLADFNQIKKEKA